MPVLIAVHWPCLVLVFCWEDGPYLWPRQGVPQPGRLSFVLAQMLCGSSAPEPHPKRPSRI